MATLNAAARKVVGGSPEERPLRGASNIKGKRVYVRDCSVIKTYVWHKDQCFFVSTIERDSSAMVSPPIRYNETIVWQYDYNKQERGEIIYMGEDRSGSIKTHSRMCGDLFMYGYVCEEP